jgi:Response regulator containing a CheY-like receiver domain and an HTH DNA-binding domain
MTVNRPANSSIRILLVDDDPAEHILLSRKLSAISEPKIDLDFVDGIEAAVRHVQTTAIDIILLDNHLVPNNDFRETAPRLREAGYTGPIGIISSDITGSYFQSFPEYGADFRIGKDEIDGKAISFILEEFLKNMLPDECNDDTL